MAEHTPFETESRERLNRMERELKRWRLGGVFVLSLAAVVVAGAVADPPADELKVHTLRVVDKDGKDRVVLTADPEKPDLTFYDPTGKSRLTLDIAADRKPVLALSESGDEQGRLTLEIEEGAPVVQLFDRAGKKRVAMGIPQQGRPLIRILDANERLQMRFP
jgi:hypothetical protein